MVWQTQMLGTKNQNYFKEGVTLNRQFSTWKTAFCFCRQGDGFCKGGRWRPIVWSHFVKVGLTVSEKEDFSWQVIDFQTMFVVVLGSSEVPWPTLRALIGQALWVQTSHPVLCPEWPAVTTPGVWAPWHQSKLISPFPGSPHHRESHLTHVGSQQVHDGRINTGFLPKISLGKRVVEKLL